MINHSPTIFAILGNSNSGKDTYDRFLRQALGSKGQIPTSVKFSQPMKDYLETAWRLPPGSLNDKGFRNSLVPQLLPSSPMMTWNDLMVRAFTHWREVHPEIVLANTFNLIVEALESGAHVTLTDLRTPEEVEAISLLVDQGYPLVLVRLWSAWEVAKPSDKHLVDNVNKLLKLSSRTQYHESVSYEAAKRAAYSLLTL